MIPDGMAKSLRGCDEYNLILAGVRGQYFYPQNISGHDMVAGSDNTGTREQ